MNISTEGIFTYNNLVIIWYWVCLFWMVGGLLYMIGETLERNNHPKFLKLIKWMFF